MNFRAIVMLFLAVVMGAAAVYLAADSGSWIAGQSIVLDGGGLVKFAR